MNERIQELAEQALDYAEENQSKDIPQHWFRLHNEKFAELIVRECADVAFLEANSRKTQRAVLQHFGVEE